MRPRLPSELRVQERKRCCSRSERIDFGVVRCLRWFYAAGRLSSPKEAVARLTPNGPGMALDGAQLPNPFAVDRQMCGMAESAHDGRERENTLVLISEKRYPSSYTAQTDRAMKQQSRKRDEKCPQLK